MDSVTYVSTTDFAAFTAMCNERHRLEMQVSLLAGRARGELTLAAKLCLFDAMKPIKARIAELTAAIDSQERDRT